MPTITAVPHVPHVGVLDALRWEADDAAPGGYGEWGARGAGPVAALQWTGEAGGLCLRRGGGGAQGRSRQPSGATE